MEQKFTEYMNRVVREAAEKIPYANEEVMDKWKEVCRQKNTSAFLHRQKELEHMLTVCGIDWSQAETDEDWEACIRQVPFDDEREQMILSMLHQIYRDFPVSGSYIERLVRRLGNPAFQKDSVRLAIVKQFIQETDYETEKILNWAKKKYGLEGEIGSADLREAVLFHLQEDVFDLLEEGITADDTQTQKNDKRDRNRKRYPLLRMADDFSVGRHRKSVDIKKELYLFALAFYMTASSDPLTDIEKNLFHDYYQDSLLKYITEDYRKTASGYEKEPSGAGINYKNYAEVILLYLLNKKDLTAREKLELADWMVDKCNHMGKRRVKKERPLFTEVYKAYFFEDIMEMETEELIDYILAHFDIPKGTGVKDALSVVSQQNTAEAVVKNLIWDLKEVYQEKDIVIGIRNWTKLNACSADFTKDKDFKKILDKIGERLQIKTDKKAWLESGIFEDIAEPTRLELITACFYRYYFAEKSKGLSLPEMIDDFCFETDELLEQCRYQKMSMKNIFDVFILFMLYSIAI